MCGKMERDLKTIAGVKEATSDTSDAFKRSVGA